MKLFINQTNLEDNTFNQIGRIKNPHIKTNYQRFWCSVLTEKPIVSWLYFKQVSIRVCGLQNSLTFPRVFSAFLWPWDPSSMFCYYFNYNFVNKMRIHHQSHRISSIWSYRKVSNISHTLVGNQIVDKSDVVGASPVSAAPTTSSFST